MGKEKLAFSLIVVINLLNRYMNENTKIVKDKTAGEPLTMSGPYTHKAFDIINKATVEDNGKNYQEAFNLYKSGIEYFLHAIKYECPSKEIKDNLRKKM